MTMELPFRMSHSNLTTCAGVRTLAMIAGILAGYVPRSSAAEPGASPRERVSLNADWRFQKGDPDGVDSKELLYDVRPEVRARGERPAEFTEAAEKLGAAGHPVLADDLQPMVAALGGMLRLPLDRRGRIARLYSEPTCDRSRAGRSDGS